MHRVAINFEDAEIEACEDHELREVVVVCVVLEIQVVLEVPGGP